MNHLPKLALASKLLPEQWSSYVRFLGTATVLPPGKDHTSNCPFSEKRQPLPTQNLPTCPFRGAVRTAASEKPPKAASIERPFEEIPTPPSLPLVGTLLDLILAGGAEYVHQYCDKRHKSLGPIYREKLGNVEAVFLSDAKLIQKVRAHPFFFRFTNVHSAQVYKFEGKYPQHMVPEPWIIYNQSKGIQRGLFFM